MEVLMPFATAVITGLIAFAGTVYTGKKQHDVTVEEVRTELELIKKDIQMLEKSVSKHNGVIERMFKVENSIDLLDEKMKVANHRIEDLEKFKEV